MLLADHAEAVGGKLYIHGGGWTITGPPAPFAIAMLFEVAWDMANDQQDFELELVDADGAPVMVLGPDGPQAVSIGGQFETGRPAGMKRGTPITFPVAFNSGPLPLQPDARYEWRLTWNGESREDWRLAFTTRSGWAPPPMPGADGE
jgi:hypothetical protein